MVTTTLYSIVSSTLGFFAVTSGFMLGTLLAILIISFLLLLAVLWLVFMVFKIAQNSRRKAEKDEIRYI